MKKTWFIFILIVAIFATTVVAIQAPLEAKGKVQQTYRNVYAYFMDEFDTEAIHDRIIETGIRDIAIEVQLYNIIDNKGNPAVTIDQLQAEIDWAKKVAKGNGSVGLVVYNESTRVGYDFDGVYRYYRDWEQRLPVMEAIAASGIDYYLLDLGEFHYSSSKDMTTYLLAMKGLLGDIDFGVYDGDAAKHMLDYEVLEQAGIYIWSDIYANGTGLQTEAGWDYPYLMTCCWMGEKYHQFNDAGDFQLARDLMIENDFEGYNIIETYYYEGILPEWVGF